MKKKLSKASSFLLKKARTLSSLDFLGVFLIVFLMGSAYFFLSRKVDYVDLTVRLLDYDGPEYSLGQNRPRAWYVEQVIPGKKQTDGLGRSLVEVIDVYQYSGPSVFHDVYVTLRLRAVKNRITDQYIFNGSPLLIHDIRSFQVSDLLINGEVIDISPGKRETKKFKAELLLSTSAEIFSNTSETIVEGVNQHIVDALETGMVIQDSLGQELVVVKDVKKEPGRRSKVGDQGYLSVIDPERTKVTLEIEVVGEEINGNYYYRKETPLISNQMLFLIFDNIAVLGTIISIEPL